MTIGEKLRILRNAQGFSQSEAALLAGIGQAHWARLETGAISPTFNTIRKVARAVRSTPAGLLTGVG